MNKNEMNKNESNNELREILENNALTRDLKKKIRKLIAFPGSNRAFIELLELWHQSNELRPIIEAGLQRVLKQECLEKYGHAMLEVYCDILAFLKSIYYPEEQGGSFSALTSAIERIIRENQWRCDYSIEKIRKYSQREYWPTETENDHSENLDLFFRQLHKKSLEKGIQPDSSEKIKASMAISMAWSISKAVIGSYQTFQVDEFTTKVILVETPVTCVSGNLAVKHTDGFGVFVPEPDMMFIKLDNEFCDGIENATRYFSDNFSEKFKNKNFSWRISWAENKDDIDIYALKGPSASAALIVAGTQELAT